ncbi:MAG: DNA polymerase III, subunit gamma and tau [Candidatus Nealsonbacteria bacterium RIFCSPHIGHO2_01_FULL_38_55]|uniref:DNA polymerase III subunit gamma/tau n=2 Tax=Candidatus Nealsoniibacteriota TaxID=1817911 RepID=A0A1G2EEQ7_9BACT|nr:MAG: polymerase III, subunit gamma and tau protein [Parcubacteria group bacterium GW2011_GWC2_39_11]OGZ19655.1 MAG: DNA polymerase III, subunit gamma and tau [Candidatus Nealsonbacteria bacterium RIFCSPHIGHO2_01_FULL_38_55]OGZ20663.1 MAG: DNA polymerase III, subunit gamma and tau [Candidatus Nealsonbacteria bacterium RIFCSPHIGHO2_02_38_10]OGZ21199.1 MAG: DNA polymerase III, subunit gamma and tau [Candidatus Nealsonbacteria bacterium RIFCSPHIGHO2_02_FULL_38_75]OGZ23602.1 MAG: DNA polymerase I
MANLVLYRKYRPQTFAEITGQEHVVQTIKNAISLGAISHAYIFSGPRGSGKTTIARLLAKAANCRERKPRNFEPCNKCSSCLEIMGTRSLDFIEIDAASHRGIDEIRELRDGVKFAPVKEKYKVFVIDECHQLTKEAANALLKTLEEPPNHAIFILATTEIHKMISTIISRCQRFDFRKLNLAEITSRLEFISDRENSRFEKSALELIALNSGGSIRDAESLLDQVLAFAGDLGKDREIKIKDIKELLGIADVEIIGKFVDLLREKNAAGALKLLQDIFEKGYDPQEFSKALIRYLRQVLILKISMDSVNPILIGLAKEDQEKMKAQVEKFSQKEIQTALNLFLDVENKTKYSSIPQLPLELATVDFINPKE